MPEGIKGRRFNIATLTDAKGVPLIFRFDSVGPGDADLTYEEAQHLGVDIKALIKSGQVAQIKFAVGKTGFVVLTPAIKEVFVESTSPTGGVIILRTNLGLEFRLEGSMAKQVMGFLAVNRVIELPPTSRPISSN